MKPTIIEVKTRKELRRFVHYPNKMYKDNPYYVPTLKKATAMRLTPRRTTPSSSAKAPTGWHSTTTAAS